MTALLLALAASAAAQSPMPYSKDVASSAPPAASTATVTASTAAAVAASTETVVDLSTGGVHVADGEKKPSRPIHAVIHPEAKAWEPLSLRPGGDPSQAETRVVLRLFKAKKGYKGAESKAKASARLHKDKDGRRLIVSVFPRALGRRRAHFEIRFRFVEGFVEDAKAALVSVVDRRSGVGAGLDSEELRAQGVEFEEDSPASGSILVSALDPRPSKSAFNAGTLKRAAFGDKDAGLADVSWSATGLPAKP